MESLDRLREDYSTNMHLPFPDRRGIKVRIKGTQRMNVHLGVYDAVQSCEHFLAPALVHQFASIMRPTTLVGNMSVVRQRVILIL